jgi:hypothetical protein
MGGLVAVEALSGVTVRPPRKQPWALRTLIACASITQSGVWAKEMETLQQRLEDNRRPAVRSIRRFCPDDRAVGAFQGITRGWRCDGNTMLYLHRMVEAVDVSASKFGTREDWMLHLYHFRSPAMHQDLYSVFAGNGEEQEFRKVVNTQNGRHYELKW